jgi:hypothetical protein
VITAISRDGIRLGSVDPADESKFECAAGIPADRIQVEIGSRKLNFLPSSLSAGLELMREEIIT